MRTNRILSFHSGLAPTETCHTASFCHLELEYLHGLFLFLFSCLYDLPYWRSGMYQVPYDLASVRLDDARYIFPLLF